jgi:hypothetical protein
VHLSIDGEHVSSTCRFFLYLRQYVSGRRPAQSRR